MESSTITTSQLSVFSRLLVYFVILDFFLFFVAETIFWMHPLVHNLLLDWFDNPPKNLNYEVHALVLKKLFINQGFYNFFLAIGGIIGLVQLKKNYEIGKALLLFVCFSAIGAGIVLAITSKAYLLSFLQAVPAAIAFYGIIKEKE